MDSDNKKYIRDTDVYIIKERSMIIRSLWNLIKQEIRDTDVYIIKERLTIIRSLWIRIKQEIYGIMMFIIIVKEINDYSFFMEFDKTRNIRDHDVYKAN